MAKMVDKNQDNWTDTRRNLAVILGITERRVSQLKNERVFEDIGRGRYNIPKCVQAYIAYREAVTKGNATEGQETTSLEEEKILYTRAKRRMEEKKLEVMLGTLHRAPTVSYVMNKMLANFKGKVLSLPTRAAPKVLGIAELPVIQDILTDEVTKCLEELSEYDPQAFFDASDDIIIPDDLDEEYEEGDADGR